ncbi:MAG: alpha/beta hydrolase [Verrucomicrobia bacterium]|jgi:hypothetical protein|nr:alpha/beta hydrolase [Verrucomicrobiota bacterium]
MKQEISLTFFSFDMTAPSTLLHLLRAIITVITLSTSTLNAERLPRESLLIYHTATGQTATAKTTEDWNLRKLEIIQGMKAVMGEIPDASRKCALNMKILEETDAGSYIRRLVSYQSEPDSRVPAYLNIPKRALQPGNKARAALCLHPTDNLVGHKVVMGLGGRDGRQYAHELAERGWITLAPAYPLLANYQPDLEALGYASGTMKAIWDNQRGMDLLETLPNVKDEGFAAIGHSLGGHNSIFTAVLDERIKVVVTSCGFDSFLDYKNGDIRGWTSIRYMPLLSSFDLEAIPFDFHELVAALAPRALFVSAPKSDDNFNWQSVRRIVNAAQPVFELWNQPHALQVVFPECGHDFPSHVRQEAYLFMENQLTK